MTTEGEVKASTESGASESAAEADKPKPAPPTRDSVVTLREITKDTVVKICMLETLKTQEKFVAPNAVSLAQALFEPDHAWFRAIYADETPVGFLMLYDDPEYVETTEQGTITRPEYYLWRFMIDARYQRIGFGRKALDLLVEHVKTRPNATHLSLSYVPDEGGPADFYHRYGFVDTGAVEDDELVSRLDLATV